MILETAGYRGHMLWSVSLDNQMPITIKAPSDVVATIRAAIYYGIDWHKAVQRERLKVWRYSDD